MNICLVLKKQYSCVTMITTRTELQAGVSTASSKFQFFPRVSIETDKEVIRARISSASPRVDNTLLSLEPIEQTRMPPQCSVPEQVRQAAATGMMLLLHCKQRRRHVAKSQTESETSVDRGGFTLKQNILATQQHFGRHSVWSVLTVADHSGQVYK